MARLVLRAVTALAMVGLLLVPVLASRGSTESSSGRDPVTITRYEAQYDVAADGTLRAVETIAVDVPEGRHGIFRYWDLADSADRGVRYRPRDVRIRLDGGPVPVLTTWEQGRRYRVAKIGDPDEYLAPGAHTYTIEYRIDGVLAPNEDAGRSELVWQVVPAGWSMPIRDADLRVSLPHPVDRFDCSVGDGRPCSVEGGGTSTLRVTAADLLPNTPVVLRSAMAAPAPDRATLPWAVEWDRLLGSSEPGLLVALLAAALAGLGGYLLDRASRERNPGLPVMFEPPPGLGPVQTAYVVDERVPGNALSATLLHLAEQGHVELTERDGDWTVTSRLDTPTWESLDPVARKVVSELGLRKRGARFAADGSVSSGESLSGLKTQLAPTVRDWGSSTGVLVPAAREWAWRVLWFVAAALAVILTLFAVTGTWVMPFATFAVGAVGVLMPGVGSRRTPQGRELWSRAGGFRRFLSTDAAQDRFDFSGREQLYTAYIPYAVAFGVADLWATKYAAATGSAAAPVPLWYGGGTGGGSAVATDLGSFDRALASSISAYAATQSSSSSGGGGGFSGGGGGGGGGGSW